MSMIPALPSKLLLAAVLAAALAATAHAQSAPAQAGSRLPWPNTGGGQPDFEFERTETFTAAAKNARAQGLPQPVLPTLDDLIEDDNLDPLGLVAAHDVSETAISATAVSGTLEISLTNPAFASLPGLSTPTDNLSEFTANLQQTATSFLQNWKPRLVDYSLDYLLRGLTLQAVVTSPQSYAVINNQQYKVGDSFSVPLSLGVPDTELLAALEATMPPQDALPPETYQAYVSAYEGFVAQLAQQKQTNPAAFTHVQSVPVTVLDIQPRKVILSLNGTRQVLQFPYAY